jgi:hypothetical protein
MANLERADAAGAAPTNEQRCGDTEPRSRRAGSRADRHATCSVKVGMTITPEERAEVLRRLAEIIQEVDEVWNSSEPIHSRIEKLKALLDEHDKLQKLLAD